MGKSYSEAARAATGDYPMTHDPVVAAAVSIRTALRDYQAADDCWDRDEADRHGQIWAGLLYAEREMAPISNAGAAQKLRNAAANVRLDPDASSERFARCAIRAAGKIERGEITPRLLRSLRALMPAAMSHDAETYNDGATAKALTHAINWCARLRLVETREADQSDRTGIAARGMISWRRGGGK